MNEKSTGSGDLERVASTEGEVKSGAFSHVTSVLAEDACSGKAVPEEVRATVDETDDVDTPVNTFRAWFIGILFTIVGTGLNTFFGARQPGIYISPFVAQFVAFPLGKVLEKTLPTRRFRILGR
jgi:hypothetical protein